MIHRTLIASDAPRAIAAFAERRLCPGAGASLLLDGWRLVGVAADVPAGRGRHATVDGRTIAVFALAGRYAAIEAGCAHDHLHPFDGVVEDGFLCCPEHGWRVDAWSGADAAGGPPARVHDAAA
ncbi:Rieske (2Fe-2S) protein, partial [Patulibacter sp. S7RM1-6]